MERLEIMDFVSDKRFDFIDRTGIEPNTVILPDFITEALYRNHIESFSININKDGLCLFGMNILSSRFMKPDEIIVLHLNQ